MVFDIGFSELLLIFVVGLIVLGPKRLAMAVKTVTDWMRALRSLATTVQNELAQELKFQEFQESLKKLEKASVETCTQELKVSTDELREPAEFMKHSHIIHDFKKKRDETNTIHNLMVSSNEVKHESMTSATIEHQEADGQKKRRRRLTLKLAKKDKV